MKITFRTPRRRPPVFRLGDEWFIDATFNWGEQLTVPSDDLTDVLAAAKPGAIVIARRLSGRELDFVDRLRMSSEHEIAGHLLGTDAARWRGLK